MKFGIENLLNVWYYNHKVSAKVPFYTPQRATFFRESVPSAVFGRLLKIYLEAGKSLSSRTSKYVFIEVFSLVKIGAINVERGKTMKTRAMKKVLSVICVLALLMSVCVVALVGTTSAAETYTLNINGNTETIDLETGAALPVPTAPYEFLGWYDSLKFDNKVEVAGDAKTLYAKFSSVVLDFENDGWNYAPNNKYGNYTVVTDPTNSGNKALKFSIGNARSNFGIPTYVGSNEGYALVQDQKYEIAFDYYVDSKETFPHIAVKMMTCMVAGVGQDGGSKNQNYPDLGCKDTDGGWKHGSQIITANGITDVNKYLVFTAYIGSGSYQGTVLFDNITVTPLASDTLKYTFSNKGEVSEYELAPGSTLPQVNGSSFKGWYDASLTVKYETAPANVTKLYAKHVKLSYDFESGMDQIYDPKSNFETNGYAEIVADGDNHAVQINAAKGTRRGFAVSGVFGGNAGYTITKGQVYSISFKYKADNKVNLELYTSGRDGIGSSGSKSSLGWKIDLDAASEWTTATLEVVLGTESAIDLKAQSNLYLTVLNGSADTTFVIDDLFIAPKAPKTTAEDIEMDFEDDFKWSVADANNYTKNSGNGYVNRGEIAEADGNKFFRVKHFAKRNSYIYFTVDDGTNHFTAVNGGIYTIEFDYLVEHSETDSKIGLLYAKPTTATSGLEFEKLVEFDSFTDREDTEWTHVSYTFYANYSNVLCTSLGLYVYNSTNVPEINIDTGLEAATSVLFDNIVVKTHSNTGDDGLIIFETNGGSDCTPIVGEGETPVGTLPEPTKFGYVFKGWKYDVAGAGDSITSYDLTAGTMMPYGITEAYAVWELDEGVVEIDFRTNVPEYDATAPILVAYPGQPIPGFPTETPVAGAAEFIGWFYDRAFTQPVDPNVAPSVSSTIYAKWTNAGTKFDFEDMPFNSVGKPGVYATDRITIKTLDDGNHVVFYDFSTGSNQSNTTDFAGIMLYGNGKYFSCIEGLDYTVTFKYKLLEAKGSGGFGAVLSQSGSAWGNRQSQTGRMNYGNAEDKWLEGSFTFTAAYNPDSTSNNSYISIGPSGDCKVYIDDVVVTSAINDMNVYGSAVIFNTNGGKDLEPISGDAGDPLNLPTPKKPGYKFAGWYVDSALTTPVTATTFGEEQMIIYAKWQLGKFTEDFEEFPNSVKQLGVHGAYTFYTNTTAGFDASNVKSGTASLFRNGATAGVKNFTAMRSKDLALTVGETYTLSFYVKPTAIGDAAGTISIMEMATQTGINQGTVAGVIKNVAELKEGEWNLVTYTFTAKSEFIAISTTAGNDMYFDDITVTLKGYTGAATGDSSVSPVVMIAMIILAAGALLVTGKKVFSK